MTISEPLEINFAEFDEYIRQGEPDQQEKASIWSMAIGLQQVDQLHVSNYLKQTAAEHIEGKISQAEVEKRIETYYQMAQSRKEESGTDEADLVSTRISRVMNSQSFTFSPSHYASIHKALFNGILPHAGTYRDYDISKKEWVLNNASVLYGAADYIVETLKYDFSQEQTFVYKGKSTEDVIAHISDFIAGIWQIHPFREGNTRTTAVFLVQYLHSLGYKIDNMPFASHSWYFRNALVRANYDNLPNGISRTTEFLQLFLRNILLGEHNELKNRYLHILWTGERSQIAKITTKVADKVADKTPDKILHILANNPLATTAQIAQQLNMSDSGVRKVVTTLKARGLLRRVGANKNGHWEVIIKHELNNNQ